MEKNKGLPTHAGKLPPSLESRLRPLPKSWLGDNSPGSHYHLDNGHIYKKDENGQWIQTESKKKKLQTSLDSKRPSSKQYSNVTVTPGYIKKARRYYNQDKNNFTFTKISVHEYTNEKLNELVDEAILKYYENWSKNWW